MTRREAVACLSVAFALITAGLVWLVGAWGLIVCGVALSAVILFVVEVEDQEREA